MSKIIFSKKARKFLAKQPQNTRERIMKAINLLPKGDVVSLKNYEPYKRLRVGDYRVVFDDKGNIIDIIDIGNRGEIYHRYKLNK